MAEQLFDTHSEFARFVDAGFPEVQAEAIVQSLSTVLINSVATTTDIEHLRDEIEQLRADIERLEKAEKANFEQLKADIERLEKAEKANFEQLKADIERLEKADKANFEQLKADIERLEATNKADIERLEAAYRDGNERLAATMESRIAQNATTHLKWLIGVAITLGGTIIGYMHYLIGLVGAG